MSKVMSVNAGSSSLKFQLIEMPSEAVVTIGLVERIGFEDAVFTIEVDGEKVREVQSIEDHGEAVELLLKGLISHKIVSTLDEIIGVAHRVVHGGEKFVDSAIIDQEVMDAIEEVSDLAPLHNPVNLIGIKAFKKALPDVMAVAVFDTAFHQTMEPEAFIYPTPYEWYEDYGVRRYGFHGTSHKYVAGRAAEILGKDLKEMNLITAHIGNGVSICAIKNGLSVDTTMGLTPLAGVAMGTRSGDIDPAIIEFIADKEDRNIHGVIKKLNKASGLLGISGVSSDGRDIRKGINEGDERCELAYRVQVKRILYFIAAYHSYMGGADAVIFTAGCGENDWHIRQSICDGLSAIGIKVDKNINVNNRGEGIISTEDSKITVMVVPTNEELMMARDVYRLMN